MVKKTEPKDVFLPGDDVCRTCTGITYMSQQMRESRKTPWCIGMRKTLTAKIPQQRLEQFEKEAERDIEWQVSIGKNRPIFSRNFYVALFSSFVHINPFYCSHLGYTLTTRRMDRTGYAPIGLVAVTYSKPSTERIAPLKDEELLKDPNFINDREVTELSQFEQAAALSAGFYEVMSRGIKIQSKKTMALVNRVSTPAFAQNFYRYLLDLSYQIERATS
jgi:hypothetical protein